MVLENLKDSQEQEPLLEQCPEKPRTSGLDATWTNNLKVYQRQAGSIPKARESPITITDIREERKKHWRPKKTFCTKRTQRCGLFCVLGLFLFWLWWLSGQPYGDPGPCYGKKTVSLVTSWVNVTDPDWQKMAIDTGCNIDYLLGGRGDADAFEALRYNLRAVHKNLDFVDHIYIITTGQYPSWLDRNQKFVTVVPHKDFTSPSRTLFNGRTVAASWGIMGSQFAGECFIHNDDDFIINRPMTIDRFFPNGHTRVQPYVNIGLGDWPLFTPIAWLWGSDIESISKDGHTTYAVHAETYKKYCRQSELCQENQHGTCNGGRIPCEPEWNGWMSRQKDVAYWSSYDMAIRSSRFVLGLPWCPPWLSALGLRIFNPTHINIRSHGSIDTIPEWVNTIRGYLHSRYPNPAPWESQKQPEWIRNGKVKQMA